MKRIIFILLISLAGISPAVAQEQAENTDVQVLQQQVQMLYQQLSRLAQEVNYLQTFIDNNVQLNVTIPAKDLPVKGNPDAPVTLVEFSDFQCPYCSTFSLQSGPGLDSAYVDTGKLRMAFFDFPLTSIHPNAMSAAEGARCAGEQDKFWEMHDELFANQRALDDLTPFAESLGLDLEAFNTCMDEDTHVLAIQANVQEALLYGIRSTPTIAIGYTMPDGSVEVRRFLRGANADYGAIIDKLIEDKSNAAK